MIDSQNYSQEEINLLYSLVESTVAEHKELDMHEIMTVLHPGDFFYLK